MKIAIYGAGSLGTVLGAYLTKAGFNVDLINRNKSHVEGLQKNGANIIGTINMQIPVSALLPEEMAGRYDLIFLMTKQLDNKKVVAYLKNFLEDDGIICSTQNGLPEPEIAEIIGKEKTFGCAIAWGATLIGNGVCELTSSPDSLSFSIGTPGENNHTNLEEIKSVLECVGTVTIETNFMGARWTKLLINCAFSGISTVLGCTFGEASRHKKSRYYIQSIIKECFNVAEAANIKIEPIQGKNTRKLLDYNSWLKQKVVFLLIPVVIKKHALLKASMLQDLEKGKLSEVDAINGVVSHYAKKMGISTPFNDRVVEIVHGIESGKYKPGFENLALFDKI